MDKKHKINDCTPRWQFILFFVLTVLLYFLQKMCHSIWNKSISQNVKFVPKKPKFSKKQILDEQNFFTGSNENKCEIVS